MTPQSAMAREGSPNNRIGRSSAVSGFRLAGQRAGLSFSRAATSTGACFQAETAQNRDAPADMWSRRQELR